VSTLAPAPGRIVPATYLLGSLAAAGGALGIAAGHQRPALALLVLGALAGIVARSLDRPIPWVGMLSVLAVIVMLVPIRRFAFGSGGGAIQLEPYRMLIGAIAFAWAVSLLLDRRVRLRATGFEAPLGVFCAAIATSALANPARIIGHGLSNEVLKAQSFALTFAIVFYMVAMLVRGQQDIERLLFVLVVSGALIGLAAVYESRSGTNLSDTLARAIPGMHELPKEYIPDRLGHPRPLGSAQHPIALGALLVLLIPFAGWLYARGRRLVGAACVLPLMVGAVATLSRTAIVMLVVELVVIAVLRPRAVVRAWPLLIPLVLAVHVAVPGAIGTLHDAFLPKGGIVAEQRGAAGLPGQGRVADLSSAISAWAEKPIAGYGYGTRDPTHDQVLDDQWLGQLLDTGVLGVGAFAWLLVRAVRRFGAAARRLPRERGNLFAAAAAATSAYGVAMFTYDSFSFIQVTLVFYMLLALGCRALLEDPPAEADAARPARVLPAAGPLADSRADAGPDGAGRRRRSPVGVGFALLALASARRSARRRRTG
jgi:hypothetical protein